MLLGKDDDAIEPVKPAVLEESWPKPPLMGIIPDDGLDVPSIRYGQSQPLGEVQTVWIEVELTYSKRVNLLFVTWSTP